MGYREDSGGLDHWEGDLLKETWAVLRAGLTPFFLGFGAGAALNVCNPLLFQAIYLILRLRHLFVVSVSHPPARYTERTLSELSDDELEAALTVTGPPPLTGNKHLGTAANLPFETVLRWGALMILGTRFGQAVTQLVYLQ